MLAVTLSLLDIGIQGRQDDSSNIQQPLYLSMSSICL